MKRQCSRSSCTNPAVATLTYVYSESTAVLGPLATHAEPHTYDLCQLHAERLTAPRGWDVVRLISDFEELGPSTDDLVALADAVREAKAPVRPSAPASRPVPGPVTHHVDPPRRGGHLRVIEGELPAEEPNE